MQYRPIKVPVLPNPALKWIAMAPAFGVLKWRSAYLKNSAQMSSLGFDPSGKNKSEWETPYWMNLFLSYLASFNLTTFLTFNSLKMSTYISGVKPDLWPSSLLSMGPMKATN